MIPPAADGFSRAPVIVIWEATRACDLACRHCRAEAQPDHDVDELDDDAVRAMMDEVRREFGPVVFVITGGDPMKRAGLERLVAHGADLGLVMAMTPSATPLLTPASIARLQAAGLRRLALSLDGADAAVHDGFRGVPGTFARTLDLLAAAKSLGLEIQVNSSLGRHNLPQLDAIKDLVQGLGVSLWSVFLLVPTGRADAAMLLTRAEHERLYRRLAEWALDRSTPFAIKTTAGQPFYRVLAQQRARHGTPAPRHGGRGVNDGNGFVFISHRGEICPSGFLAIPCGDVRRDGLARTYREHPTFRRLREPASFSGKCGICPFHHQCGGSRSRTWALTGDPFASDPTCVFTPPGYAARVPS